MVARGWRSSRYIVDQERGGQSAVVHLAWAYIEWRFAQERSAQVQRPADIIRRHREEHARDWLSSALEMALACGAIEPVLQRFLPSTAY